MPKKSCLECSEPFEFTEFSSYMLKLRSSTVPCVRCGTENYIVPSKGIKYFGLLILSILLGLLIFLAANIVFAMATYDPSSGSFRIGTLPAILGAVLGLGAARVIMNIFNWITGTVSTDRIHKSIADYE